MGIAKERAEAEEKEKAKEDTSLRELDTESDPKDVKEEITVPVAAMQPDKTQRIASPSEGGAEDAAELVSALADVAANDLERLESLEDDVIDMQEELREELDTQPERRKQKEYLVSDKVLRLIG